MARSAKPWFRKDRKAWFVTIDGVRHNLGPDKTEAFHQFHSLMQQPKHSAPARSRSFVATADAFLDWLKKNRAAETFEWYRYRIERFCQKYPELNLADLKPFHVQQWVDAYADLSRTSRRNYLRSIKRCVNWACRQGYLNQDPIRDLEVPSADRREVSISRQEFDHILSFVSEPGFRELCQLTFETGCRPQESLIVEARHFDAKHSRWVFPVKESKGKRQPRIVYLSPFAEELSKRLVSQYPTGPLLRNSVGEPWTTDAVNCAFTRLQQRMGKQAMKEQGVAIEDAIRKELKNRGDKRRLDELSVKDRRKFVNFAVANFAPKYCLYSLRHGFATGALQAGLDALTVGILLGHNDPSTLSRVYQHLTHNPEHLLKQVRQTLPE